MRLLVAAFYIFILVPSSSRSCGFSFQSAGQEVETVSLAGRNINFIKLLAAPNFGASFLLSLDGRPMVVRIEQGVYNQQQANIARLVNRGGFGVRTQSIAETPSEIRTLLNLPPTLFADGRHFEIERLFQNGTLNHPLTATLMPEATGLEFKGVVLYRNQRHLPISSIQSHLVARRLKDFLQFCNESAIKIGTDFQYFVTAESGVVVFDYDLYEHVPLNNQIATQNEELFRPILEMWQRGISPDIRPIFKPVQTEQEQ